MDAELGYTDQEIPVGIRRSFPLEERIVKNLHAFHIRQPPMLTT